jgi:FtsH-binding integral membrane protein
MNVQDAQTYPGVQVQTRPVLMGQVLGLLGFAFVFTAAGALLGLAIGPGGLLLSAIASFACLIALIFARERSPLNLILLYAFATCEGILLGPLLEVYVAQGLGSAVINAALTTGAVSLLAGVIGATTKRDLSGVGSFLMVGLLGIVIASLIGLFLQSSALQIAISVAAVIVFSGLLVYDVNRVAKTVRTTEGNAIMLAVNIYLDVLNLFVALLRIFGLLGSKDE